MQIGVPRNIIIYSCGLSHAACGIVCIFFSQKETFIARDLHTAFEEDALASSHPLSPPAEDIQTDSEIEEMFDAITYSKVESQMSLATNTQQSL